MLKDPEIEKKRDQICRLLRETFNPDDKIALKLHFGEPGNEMVSPGGVQAKNQDQEKYR